MNIAFDFHGVLEKYPDKFKAILTSMRVDHFITILSGPPSEQIYEEVTKSGYRQGHHYDHIVSVVDWVTNQGCRMYQHDNGSYFCDDETWWSSKAKICEEKHIRMLFDDSLRYKEYITKEQDLLFVHIQ